MTHHSTPAPHRLRRNAPEGCSAARGRGTCRCSQRFGRELELVWERLYRGRGRHASLSIAV